MDKLLETARLTRLPGHPRCLPYLRQTLSPTAAWEVTLGHSEPSNSSDVISSMKSSPIPWPTWVGRGELHRGGERALADLSTHTVPSWLDDITL